MAWRYEVVERAHRPSLPMTTHTDGDKENRLNIPSDFFLLARYWGFVRVQAHLPGRSRDPENLQRARPVGGTYRTPPSLGQFTLCLPVSRVCVCVKLQPSNYLRSPWTIFGSDSPAHAYVNHLARLADRPPGYR
jgi:hypothetical protein